MLMNPPKIQIFIWGRGLGWQVGKALSISLMLLFWLLLKTFSVSQSVNVWLLLHPVAVHLLGAETFPFYVHSLFQTPKYHCSHHSSIWNSHFGITFQWGKSLEKASERLPYMWAPSMGHTLGTLITTMPSLLCSTWHTTTLQACFGRCKPSPVFCATAWQRISHSLSWNHVLDCVNMS